MRGCEWWAGARAACLPARLSLRSVPNSAASTVLSASLAARVQLALEHVRGGVGRSRVVRCRSLTWWPTRPFVVQVMMRCWCLGARRRYQGPTGALPKRPYVAARTSFARSVVCGRCVRVCESMRLTHTDLHRLVAGKVAVHIRASWMPE